MNTSPRAIHHLSCGTLCPHGARLIAGEGGLLASARLVCHCLLIEGAEGLILVDTGFGLDDARNPRQLGRMFNALVRPRISDADTAISQIRELGFEPSDVRHIITTHLDLDHAGGLPDFPEAEVHLLGLELQAAMDHGWRDGPRYVAAH
jgi:glyoxylase-like metal-dependent hydrolase (beta-lactamase superfamily II)